MRALYDAGVLIAADRSDRVIWADHRARLDLGAVPRTTAPVVAQVSHSSRQVQLRRLLRGCEVVAFAADDAHHVGLLLGQAGTSDVVDGHVATIAARAGLTVLTSDPDDFARLSDHLPEPIRLQRV